jgi:hypothetical protein
VKVLVDWLLAQRLRLIVVAVVAAPLLSVVSAALIALETARRGAVSGALSAAAMVGGLALLAVLSRADVPLFAGVGLVCAVTGVAIGGLIRRAGNLVLAFQAAVLFCLGAVLLVGVIGIDARPFFEPAVAEFVALLPSDTPPEQVTFVEQRLAEVLLASAVFLQVTGALLLGFWWTLLAAGERRFGHEFRQLKLGRLLGVAATGFIVLGLVFDAPVVQNLTLLGLLAFLVQGVAVLHAWAHAKQWHPLVLAALYLLLLMPGLNVVIVLPISMMGLVDQWFDLRASSRSRT